MLTLEQLALRKTGLTASDIAAVAGVSKWRSPLDVYLDKTSPVPEFIDPPSEAQERGNILEPVIAAAFTTLTGLQTMVHGETIRHPSIPWMLATPDYRVGPSSLLECKTSFSWFAEVWGESAGHEIPPDPLCQVTWQRACIGSQSVCYVAVLLGNDDTFDLLCRMAKLLTIDTVAQVVLTKDFRWYAVEYDAAFESNLIRIGERFWHEHIEKGIPPAAAGTDIDTLKLLYPTGKTSIREVRPEETELIEAYTQAKVKFQVADTEFKTQKAALIQLLGDSEGLQQAGKKLVTYRNDKPRETVDYEAIVAELKPAEDVIKRHTKTVPGSRRLLDSWLLKEGK